MKRRVLFVVAGAAIVAVPLIDGCRAPTQVTLDIRTRASCNDLRGVDIIVGEEPLEVQSRVAPRVPTTSTSQCAGDRIGTLVVTPSSTTGSVAIIAGFGGRPASECTPNDNFASCIVARRRFAFIEHASITLPIFLDPDCVGIPCGATETCIGKKCVDSEVTCEESGTCTEPGVLPDGTPKPLPDSSIDGPFGDGPLADGGPGDGSPPLDGTTNPSDAKSDATPGPSACGTTLFCPLTGNGAKTECTGSQAVCCYGTPTGICAISCPNYPTACCGGSDQCLGGQVCCVLGGGPTFTATTRIACGQPQQCAMTPPMIKICRTSKAGPSDECGGVQQCGPSPFGPFFVCQ